MDNICFVCKDLMMVPRIYECGHTLCERCMKKSDQAEKNKIHSVFEFQFFIIFEPTIIFQINETN